MSAPTWHIERRRVRDLRPYEFNPRQLTREQHEQLTASIQRFGLVEIPVINTDGVLIAGHQRTRILIEQGQADTEIDVRVPDRALTEAEFKEYLLRSNKNTGEWNFDILANSFELDDLKMIGFTEAELGLGFGDDPAPEGEPENQGPKVHQCPSCSFRFTD